MARLPALHRTDGQWPAPRPRLQPGAGRRGAGAERGGSQGALQRKVPEGVR